MRTFVKIFNANKDTETLEKKINEFIRNRHKILYFILCVV